MEIKLTAETNLLYEYHSHVFQVSYFVCAPFM